MQRLCLPPTAKHQGCLEGSGSLQRSVWTWPIRRPLSREQLRVFPLVQLSLEELVFLMWQFDAQRRAPICGGQVLLHTSLPDSCLTTLSWSSPVQQLSCGLIHGCGSRMCDFEDKLDGSWDFSWWVSLSVMTRGSEDECRLRAGRVWVMLVDPLPHVLVWIKGEVSGEELDVGACFTSLADPAAGQRQRCCRAAGQHRGALLCGAVH